MNKAEFIDLIAKDNNISKAEAERAINMYINGTIKALNNNGKKDGTIQLIGFGTYKVLRQKARKGRNPQTGKEIEIKASNRPTFTAGQKLKDAVN